MTSTIKISSIELPKDDRYKLTKIKAKKGLSAMIITGDSSIGVLGTNPIEVGQRCAVWRSMSSGIDTSPITAIELTDDPSKILLHTHSKSVYELVNLDMVKNVITKV